MSTAALHAKRSAPPFRGQSAAKRRDARERQNRFDALSVDELAIVFGFLDWREILRIRTCRKWRDAASRTLVPPSFRRKSEYISIPEPAVKDERGLNALASMTKSLPSLQQLSIEGTIYFKEGQESFEPRPNWWSERPPHHDISTICSFRKLSSLSIGSSTHLNGRYPCLFNFPCLRKLKIDRAHYLKWDLGMLTGMPLLEELHVRNHPELRGDVKCLTPMKYTLRSVAIVSCSNVTGNFMDLADFPVLQLLDLYWTGVTGDVRDMTVRHFSQLKKIHLPRGVCGMEFQHISDVPKYMRAIYHLKTRTSSLFDHYLWPLSYDSPDSFDEPPDIQYIDRLSPPFWVEFVKVGPRLGWRWTNDGDHDRRTTHTTEVNWLDQEPEVDSKEYVSYRNELSEIQQYVDLFQGFHRPPTEEEYRQLCCRYPWGTRRPRYHH